MAIPRTKHDDTLDPAYFALRPKKQSGGGGDIDELTERVERLEECCEEVQPQIVEMNEKVVYMYQVVETLDKMTPISNPEIDIVVS